MVPPWCNIFPLSNYLPSIIDTRLVHWKWMPSMYVVVDKLCTHFFPGWCCVATRSCKKGQKGIKQEGFFEPNLQAFIRILQFTQTRSPLWLAHFHFFSAVSFASIQSMNATNLFTIKHTVFFINYMYTLLRQRRLLQFAFLECRFFKLVHNILGGGACGEQGLWGFSFSFQMWRLVRVVK